MSEIINKTGGDAGNDGAFYWGNFANSWLVLSLYGIICVLGIVGNLLASFVLIRVQSLRSNTSDFLVHLSLVDLLVCLLVIPYKLFPTTTGELRPSPGFIGELRCRLYISQYISWVCAFTSVFGLMTINLERFVAIVHPHKYKLVFTKRNKYLMIAACWVMGALSVLFVALVYDEEDGVGCKFVGYPNGVSKAASGLALFIVAFFVPFLFMIWVQWVVISTLKRQVKALKARLSSSAFNQSDQQKMWQLRTTKKLARTLLTFVITFVVCWIPNQIYFMLYTFGVHEEFDSPFYHVTVILATANSCVNPIVYVFTNKPFRRGIRKAFCMGSNAARVGDEVTGDVATGTVSHALSTNVNTQQ